jgi:transcriptional regulator with XRE-family HTH domain
MARRNRGDAFLPPGPRHELVVLLKGLLAAKEGMTLGSVAARARLGAPYVGEVLRGWRTPSPDAAWRIAKALYADDATAKRARDLAELVRKSKLETRHDRRRDDPLPPAVTALLRAWHALEPEAAGSGLTSDSPVRQALEAAVACAVTQYATGDGRLDIAGPLLTTSALLAQPEVAAEFAKVLARRGAPDADLIGRCWRAALTDPTHTRDFGVEAAALLEAFQAQVTGELSVWLRGGAAAGQATLAERCVTARRGLADAVGLLGRVTVGPLPPGLRICLQDQTSLIAEHVSGFVGRDALLRQIQQVIETRDSAYCHVLAHPGVGKTALMATLVRNGNYIHHFNVLTAGVVTPQTFLANICARLIARYQPDRALPGLDAFGNGGYLSELLRDIASRRRDGKIIIVVDALDESDSRTLLPGTNPLFLPASLPDGVVFVVSSRPVDETKPIGEWEPTQINAGGEQVVIPIDHLGDANMADIREYLAPWPAKAGVAGYLSRFGYDATAFTEKLAQLSEGNFMYLRHLLPAIERGEFADCELTDLPLGLRPYYADQLERMRDENDDLWYRYRLPVIAAFVQARSRPLTIGEIAELSGVGSEAIVRDTLRRWSAFVVAEPVPGDDGVPQAAYRIYHASFAEFLGAST